MSIICTALKANLSNRKTILNVHSATVTLPDMRLLLLCFIVLTRTVNSVENHTDILRMSLAFAENIGANGILVLSDLSDADFRTLTAWQGEKAAMQISIGNGSHEVFCG